MQTQTLIYKNLFRRELLDQSFLDSMLLFNQHDYKAAYDSFFELWYNTQAPNRKLLFQGLVQISAAMKLLQEKKVRGSIKVLRNALNNLMNFEQIEKPFNIRKLIVDCFEYFETVDKDIDVENCDVELKQRPKIYIDKSYIS